MKNNLQSSGEHNLDRDALPDEEEHASAESAAMDSEPDFTADFGEILDPKEERRRKNPLYRAPIMTAWVAAWIPAMLLPLFSLVSGVGSVAFLWAPLTFGVIVFLPLILTVENLWFLLADTSKGIRRTAARKIECFSWIVGVSLTVIYFLMTSANGGESVGVVAADWWEQLYASQIHSPVEPASIPTVVALTLVGFAGYLILRLLPLDRQPPLLTALSIAALYIGGGVAVVWMIQICEQSIYWMLLIPAVNILLIYARTLRLVICEKRKLLREASERGESSRLSGLAGFFSRTAMLPVAGFVLAIPLLGVLVLVLTLFGQQPDAIIRAWTETADWTLSRQIAPPNLPYDGHYLCTVAAGGHKRVVKPLRTGKRHGHTVIVNRQLCVANAFEQLLEERTPRFHRLVRGAYDRYGLPVARLIRSQFAADAVYILMKPAEWIFLAVLYLFDLHPENRIAVQYPHSPVPKESSH